MRVRLVLVGVLLALPALPHAPAHAVVCYEDDGPGMCCEDTAEKVNGISRRLTGQEVLLCPH